MVFSSATFLFFFLPIALLFGLMLPGLRFRNLFLLLASLFFYAWGEGQLVVLMICSIICNYFFGLWIDQSKAKKKAKSVLALAVVFNLGMLGFYKYANFLVDNFNILLEALSVSPVEIAAVQLPIGISFFTFQSLSYVIDVYRKEAEVQRNPANIALYISLFPQLIAGPIVRYHDVAQQIVSRKTNWVKFESGVKRFIIGLGKKVLIANTVAYAADQIYALPVDQISFGMAWLAAICYALQIYFDFSGYSDMAIGLGRMFGFDFLENFNYPYVARSMRDFWKRWHISLTNWFRDYLYIPLGGNRKGTARTYANLLIVFFLTGMWHGASWSFIAWGMLHGFFMVMERLWLGKLMDKVWRPFQHVYVLLVAVFAWVPFRMEELGDVVVFWKTMLGLNNYSSEDLFWADIMTNELSLIIVLALIGSMPVLPWIINRLQHNEKESNGLVINWVSAAGYLVVFLFCIMSLAVNTYNPFIYFRF